MAWSNVSKNLMSQIEQIEESRRCKVRIAEDWVAFEGKSDEGFKGVNGEAMKEEMDDMGWQTAGLGRVFSSPDPSPLSVKRAGLGRARVRKAGENRLKPAKQLKQRSEVEPRVVGDHTPTLKSELDYLRLESLQALSNRGFEVEETLAFLVVCL
ncbi:hypothetical protein WN944_018702 [Citrus x changshan-huyou]|uniref:Uncharacterized protein n=1 Tax=Citrus x changshan-huyou TaxID=2935761 RepID=A0AAP0QEF2_9ROSI